MEFLQVKNLSFEYPKRSKKALDNISFSVKKGEFVLLYGESGCGKTTLLQTLITQIAPIGKLSGSISFNGEDISSVNAGNIGFVSQQPDGQIVTDRVWSELAFGPENLGIKPDIIKGRIAEMSNYFGIQDWFHKSTYELSGGQKQILNLASVMITQPKLLILDEPTAGLDPKERVKFRNLFSSFAEDKIVILSTHIVTDVEYIADEILVIKGGTLLKKGAESTIIQEISGKVWECRVTKPEAERLENRFTVCNSKTENGEAVLRIVSDSKPCDTAVSVSPCLEDLYLYYFHGEV